MDWRIKGVVQKTLSVVPAGRKLNGLMQSRMGGLQRFDAMVEAKVINDWLVLLSHFRELQFPLAGKTAVEIGTGWFPTLPACFAIAGVSRCLTFDVSRLLDWKLTQRMLVALERHMGAVSAATQIPYEEVHARWGQLARADSLQSFLDLAGIDYRAPGDASRTGLDAGSVDIVFSNSVLEHVESAAIGQLMAETRRILRPGGVAVHSVNCGDHYAYFDRKVTQVHYLRFSSSQWRWWNNSMQYQNRLRANDFLEIAAREGLNIVLNKQKPRAELLARFDESQVAPEFRHYSREQLCTTSIDFVAQAPAG